MGILYTKDKTHYHRWVNILPALLVPGASQYLSGRKKAGILWFVAFYFFTLLMLFWGLYPGNSFSPGPDSLPAYLKDLFCLAAIVEGLRRPIPAMKIKKAAAVFILIFLVSVGPAVIVRGLFIQAFRIPSDAMLPTLKGAVENPDGSAEFGDYIFVNKAAYLAGEPGRGDVIVFKSSEIPSLHYTPKTLNLKRVVGLPGERVSLDPPYLVINGTRVSEPGIFRKMGEKIGGLGGYCFVPSSKWLGSGGQSILLKDDEYFVLGDNSRNSADSRQFGPIKRSAIIGKAVYIYQPASRKGFIE